MPDPFLTISNGAGTSRFTIRADRVSLGRISTNDIILSGEEISRSHAVIELGEEGYQIRDLKSSNGTRLNGARLSEPARLFKGDVIGIGRHQITVEFGQPRPVEDVEILTAEDLIEPEELDVFDLIDEDNNAVSPFDLISVGEEGAEETLATLADNLPNQEFTASEVELTDSRGQIVHGTGASRKSLNDPGGAVELLRLLLLISARARATDIHIEPREQEHAVRLRVDGLMIDIVRVPVSVGLRIATVVKVLCEIDISQRKLIQEGSFAARMPDASLPGHLRRVDYRVSYAPAVFGQKLVVRILDSSGAPSVLTDLDMPRKLTERVASVIHRESGMVLVVGPTGSGKTTTLYSLLRSIDLAKRNVVTIEDPVEVHLNGITQIPVDEAHERSFLQVLRSVLRQDPDVILVGEIRDTETARVAMQAAITGHMVFSTLHTQDTLGTIFRLRDLGVEPYMLSQSLQLVIAQRLIRTLCPNCKRAARPTEAQLKAMGPAGANVKKIFTPTGCGRCLGTGHFGRRGYFEMLSNTEELSRAILTNAGRDEFLKVVNNGDFVPLRQAAYRLVALGEVGFDEVDPEAGFAT